MLNQNLNHGGIHRAFLIDFNSELRMYIPGINNNSECPVNKDDSLNVEIYQKNIDTYPRPLWCIPNIEAKQHDQVHPCWVVFENGDIGHPIIVGYLGKGIKYHAVSVGSYGGGSGSGGSGGSYGSGGGSYDDGSITDWVLLGSDFTITHYCTERYPHICNDGSYKTATGTEVTPGRTIAVDPTVIPYGTRVKILDHVYVAEDCGGAIKGHRIDIAVDTHDEAMRKGKLKGVSVYVPAAGSGSGSGSGGSGSSTGGNSDDSNVNMASGVSKYSLAKDGDKQLSTHFKVKDFKCNDGSDTILISSELVKVLEQIRSHFNAAVYINSAYRTESYNKKVGGATNSQHRLGTAADIRVSGVTPSKVYSYADKLLTTGGVGSYSTFTHVDVRSNRSRWSG